MPDEGTTGTGTPAAGEGQTDESGGLLAALGLRRTTPQEQTGTGEPGSGQPGGATPPREEDKTGRQDGQLGDAGLSALEKEREARRDAERALKKFQEDVEWEKSQAQRNEREKLEAERDRYKSRAEESDQTILRVRVAAAKQLPPGLALRVQGNTEAEMMADADRLLAELDGLKPRVGFDGGAREPASSDSPEEAHRKLILGLLGRDTDQPT
jgi:hypothetical protein